MGYHEDIWIAVLGIPLFLNHFPGGTVIPGTDQILLSVFHCRNKGKCKLLCTVVHFFL